MKTKEVKDIIDILTTEVKINEIDKTFLENVPKVPTHAETFRSKNIFITLALGGLLSALLITLMIFTINNPFFSKDKPNPVTETKKQMTYQVVGCFALIDGIDPINNMSTSKNTLVEEEIGEYLELAEKYLLQDEIQIESLISDDKAYANLYKITLDETIYYYFNETTTQTGDIDEVSSFVEGYILSGNNKYKVEGSKEVKEGEVKTSLKTYYKADTYVLVEQEIEAHENEYTFKYFNGTTLVKKLELEMEKHISYQELEIEEENKNIEFVLSNNVIIADVEFPGLFNGEVLIYIEEEGYVYNIED